MNKIDQTFVQKLLDQGHHIGLTAGGFDIIFARNTIADFLNRNRPRKKVPDECGNTLHAVIDAFLQVHDDDFAPKFAGDLLRREHHVRREIDRGIIRHKA